jgi:ATP-dependent Clp protease ATP-binding subunit ClpA
MYERFTDRARKVLQLANEEAQRFNHEYIGTEHILLGLIKEGSGVAANVLKNLDVDLRKTRLEVEKLVQSGPDMVTMGRLPQTPRAKKVIEYAMEEVRNLNHNYLGTEHILLGLFREREGVAAQVLINLGLKLEDVREEVLRLLGKVPDQWATVRMDEPVKVVAKISGLIDPASGAFRDRFTGAARNILLMANEEARRHHHEYVATDHLLLALAREETGVAASILKNLGVDRQRIRLKMERAIESGPEDVVPLARLPWTPRAKSVIDHARHEADKLARDLVGSEHILLGLLRIDEGVAWQTLTNLGLSLATLRAEISRYHGGAESDAVLSAVGDRPQPVEPPAACPSCGRSPVARVLSSRDRLREEEEAEISTGKAILGGHQTDRPLPPWVCLHCAPGWSEVHRLAFKDYQWQSAKEDAVSAGDFQRAAMIRDAQLELRRRVDALIEGLLKT